MLISSLCRWLADWNSPVFAWILDISLIDAFRELTHQNPVLRLLLLVARRCPGVDVINAFNASLQHFLQTTKARLGRRVNRRSLDADTEPSSGDDRVLLSVYAYTQVVASS